jgi:predicted dehydrogenase
MLMPQLGAKSMNQPQNLPDTRLKTYRAAIVGLGFIGGGDQVSGDAIGGQKVTNLDGTHCEALCKHPQIQLVAGSSRDQGRRDRFEQRTGARTYADWQEMLAKEKLDILSVATYSPQHAEITIAAAKAGVKAVYCEKPIATRPADARAMIAACEKSGTLLVINHNRRFNPNYRKLRAFVTAGGLGQLTSATVQWGGGRLGNVGTHVIDALSMVTGRRVIGVAGALDPTGRADVRGNQFKDPGAWGLIHMEGGLVATLDAPDMGKTPLSIRVNGTLGYAVTGGRDVTVNFWDGSSENWPAPQGGSSMDVAVSEIIEHLENKTPVGHTPAEALEVLEAIVGFHISDERNGVRVGLPLSADLLSREVKSG